MSKALANAPPIRNAIAALPRTLDESQAGGRSAAAFVAIVVSILVAAFAVEVVLRGVLSRFKARLAVNAVPEMGMRSLIYLGALALLDTVPVLALWLRGELAVGALFPTT